MRQPDTLKSGMLPPSADMPPTLFYGILRSFVALATTLNLSRAMLETGCTRQTLRRHVAQLEDLKGGTLFVVEERRYFLTALGEILLPEAERLIADAATWLSGEAQVIDGLQVLRQDLGEEGYFFQQQHQVDRAFSSSGTMLQDVIKAWSNAEGQLSDEALVRVRPFCNVFRRLDGKLIFTEVGALSSFVSWFGSIQAMSTIGRTLGNLPGGKSFARLVDVAYDEIERSHALRLDHIHCLIPKEGSATKVPISYERLMLAARFPDQSPAIISVVRRTYDLEIESVADEMIRRMPQDALMD